MSKKTAAKIALRDALIQLVEINNQFREQVIADSHLPAWIMREEETTVDDREQAARISTRLTYIDQQNKQETARLTGIVGITSPTLDSGLQLNTARDVFKKTMTDYRRLFGDSIEAIEETSDELREGLLGGMKIQHIHFVQSYRQLKLFDTPPKRIGFSWAAHHSGSVKLSAEEAIEHLQKKYMASASIQKDIELLLQLSKTEPVVIKRLLAPHLRANLTWSQDIQALRQSDASLRKTYPAQINTPLPVFVRLDQGRPLPEFNRIRPFDPAAKQERLTRSDAKLVKISDNPNSRIYKYA